MDDTARYYEQFAEAFFTSTVEVDMAPLHRRFLDHLRPGAAILDAGCGSGRDAKVFADLGFAVTAFDASPALAKLASAHCGFEVGTRCFDDVDEVSRYDAIWCCASLLHVPIDGVPGSLARLWRALRPGGVMYVSFKHGTGEREQNGRRFTDADEVTVSKWVGALPDVRAVETWVSEDQRPERSERWTNVLVHRVGGGSRRLVSGEADHFLPHLSQALEIGRAHV